ncbi:unnamed protein product [Onchocerca flexuosa]|uniref:Ovule protein n=1 Tax=Onchocerca flexuosa TaxID=387005 RepID=A0A183I2Y8_9BILA|nr:unnamed protein product [Onchocerca flexuosa]
MRQMSDSFPDKMEEIWIDHCIYTCVYICVKLMVADMLQSKCPHFASHYLYLIEVTFPQVVITPVRLMLRVMRMNVAIITIVDLSLPCASKPLSLRYIFSIY